MKIIGKTGFLGSRDVIRDFVWEWVKKLNKTPGEIDIVDFQHLVKDFIYSHTLDELAELQNTGEQK